MYAGYKTKCLKNDNYFTVFRQERMFQTLILDVRKRLLVLTSHDRSGKALILLVYRALYGDLCCRI